MAFYNLIQVCMLVFQLFKDCIQEHVGRKLTKEIDPKADQGELTGSFFIG